MLRLVKLLALLLLITLPTYGQAGLALVDNHSQAAGPVTATTLKNGSDCVNASDSFSIGGSPVYSTTQVMNNPGPMYINGCAGSPFQGNAGLSIRTGNGTTDTWKYNIGGGGNVSVSIGMWWYSGAGTLTSGDLCDQGAIEAGNPAVDTYFQLAYDNTHGLYLRIEGGSTNNGAILIQPNTWYWRTLQNNGGTGTYSYAAVFDVYGNLMPNLNGVSTGGATDSRGFLQVTTVNGQTPSNPVVYAEGSSVGSCSSDFSGTFEYGQNFTIDRTGATFPIMPPTGFLSNGILSAAKTVDWTQAGLLPIGGIPSASWTQCTTAACNTVTTNGSSSTIAQINAALASASANQYVLLPAGTYTFSSGGNTFPTGGKVALRGVGANATLLVWTGTGVSCFGGTLTCLINVSSSDGTFPTQPPANIYNWTAGYAKGSNKLTLSSGAGIVTGTTGATMLFADQCDDGYTGTTCAGSSTDNGGYYNCSDQYNATGPTGCSDDGGDGFVRPHRNQVEVFTVSSCNPSPCAAGQTVVTVTPPIMNPNWSSGQSPQVYLIQPVSLVGVENLSIDGSATTSISTGVGFMNASYSWVSGVRINGVFNWGLYAVNSTHLQWESLYCYNIGQNYAYTDPYCFRSNGGNLLLRNYITEKTATSIVFDGPSNGDVIADGFEVNHYQPNDDMGPGPHPHARSFGQLYEGNITTMLELEVTHATHMGITNYRDFSYGTESCANGQCGSNTAKDFLVSPVILFSYSRGNTSVDSVLGLNASFPTNGYQSTTTYNNTIFALGIGNVAPGDPLVKTDYMRWNNYDTITAATRLCGTSANTGWSAICGSTSEIPTGALAVFQNIVPVLGDTTIGEPATPASLYTTTKPSYYPSSIPFPAIGPDVTGGTMGQCTGTFNTAGQFNQLPSPSNAACGNHGFTASSWAGHVNLNPAANCYFNVMGGNPDGTNGLLSFNANTCYSSSPTCPAPVLAPVAPYTGPALSVSITDTCTTIIYTTNGTTPTESGCSPTNGTVYSGPIFVNVTTTVEAIACESGFTTSLASSGTYTIAPPAPLRQMFAGNSTYIQGQQARIQ